MCIIITQVISICAVYDLALWRCKKVVIVKKKTSTMEKPSDENEMV